MDKEIYEKIKELILSPDESNYQLAIMLYKSVYPNTSDLIIDSYFKFIIAINSGK